MLYARVYQVGLLFLFASSVDYDAILGVFVRLVPVVDLPVDLVPLVFLLDPGPSRGFVPRGGLRPRRGPPS